MIVKICGVTNPDDARAAVEAGADALGFNFYPASPRFLPEHHAIELLSELPPGILKVGVFVNQPADRVLDTARRLGLDIVQLHGDDIQWPEGLRVWRALRVSPGWDACRLDDPRADAFLLDAAPAGIWGGSGMTFDWELARHPQAKVIIAGGLDENNVREAIRRARPWGVDACSRLECAPGRKDHARMRRFIREARAALSGEPPC
jgi:phosphoribosylanthranilate isomerase